MGEFVGRSITGTVGDNVGSGVDGLVGRFVGIDAEMGESEGARLTIGENVGGGNGATGGEPGRFPPTPRVQVWSSKLPYLSPITRSTSPERSMVTV